jgi:hypothetical protein
MSILTIRTSSSVCLRELGYSGDNARSKTRTYTPIGASPFESDVAAMSPFWLHDLSIVNVLLDRF